MSDSSTIINMINAETIKAMTDRIVEKFQPKKIILFGSQAIGKDTEDSDVDFIVIMPFEGRRLDIEVDILKALNDIRGPKDVIVLTPEEFERKKDVPGTIAYPAAHEGRVLYAL